jgi:hypothetical protein
MFKNDNNTILLKSYKQQFKIRESLLLQSSDISVFQNTKIKTGLYLVDLSLIHH